METEVMRRLWWTILVQAQLTKRVRSRSRVTSQTSAFEVNNTLLNYFTVHLVDMARKGWRWKVRKKRLTLEKLHSNLLEVEEALVNSWSNHERLTFLGLSIYFDLYSLQNDRSFLCSEISRPLKVEKWWRMSSRKCWQRRKCVMAAFRRRSVTTSLKSCSDLTAPT